MCCCRKYSRHRLQGTDAGGLPSPRANRHCQLSHVAFMSLPLTQLSTFTSWACSHRNT